MSKPTFAFDKEQEFFVDLQGLEMYHTDVVEALNSLLKLVPVIHDIKMQATRMQRGTAEPRYLEADLEIITKKATEALDALPGYLKK